MSMSFDYVIAGGGSAGCALAARLAEDSSVTVAVVEAGGRGRDLFVRMPAGNGFVFGNPRLDWGYESTPQPALGGRTIYYPRGKALGGSSIVNGMIYMRGVRADYDGWRQAGLTGWGYDDLLPYFRRSEASRDRDDEFHGRYGPLKTEPAANFGVLDQAFIDAAVAAGHEHLDDFNGAGRTGVARVDSTVSKGVRQSSAIAYLGSKRPNLALLTHRQVAKIRIADGRASAIETISGEVISARREIIICQGAFGTPQLLMLSGIGPAEHLRDHGIAPIVDLPGVGENLADHVDVSIQYGSDFAELSHARHQRLDRAAMLMGRWLMNGSGPGGGSLFSVVLFNAAGDRELPETEVFMTPMIIDENLGNGGDEHTPLMQRLGRQASCARPKGGEVPVSRSTSIWSDQNRLAPSGFVTRTRSSHPAINPNFLSSPQDIQELITAVKDMRTVMRQPPDRDAMSPKKSAPGRGSRATRKLSPPSAGPPIPAITPAAPREWDMTMTPARCLTASCACAALRAESLRRRGDARADHRQSLCHCRRHG